MIRWGLPVLGLATMACNGDATVTGTETEIRDYAVDIRVTEFGIPHVLADDFYSAGVGIGYAMTREHLCTMADQFVKVNSQRARYHGPGEGDINVNRDFGWLALGVRRVAEENYSALPTDERDMIEGFAAGYNRYLDDTPEADRDPRCATAEWVLPIDELDLFTYYMSLAQQASGRELIDVVGTAQPPAGRRSPYGPFPPPDASFFDNLLKHMPGSNGWGLGADRTESGRGMLLINPHFPSDGPLKLFEQHITIPGELNIYGAGLINVLVPLLGFNEGLARMHPVSPTPRFVVYQHELDPDDPTRYLYDGEFVSMTSTDYTIEVLGEDGSLSTRNRTLWRTQYGPVFNAPLVGWSPFTAFSYRDANSENINIITSFLGAAQAESVAELEQVYRDVQGVPWVHTVAADRDGNALYADAASAPNLSPEAFTAYQEFLAGNLLAQNFAGAGIWVVDGSNPVFEWVDDDRAALTGLVPYDDAPSVTRRDYVVNANQNYWAANPDDLITGVNAIYGAPGQTLTPRTKMNLRYVVEEDGASGPDQLFSLEELASAALDSRAAIAEDLREQVVARCTGAAPVTVAVDGQPAETVDLTQACTLLGAWDGRSTVDAVGAVIWREFVLVDGDRASLQDQGRLYADAWDVNDMIYTPTSLVAAPTEGPDPILEALATAVLRLQRANVAIDAELGQVQYYERLGQRYARPGGQQPEGHIAIADWGGLPDSVLPYDVPPPALNPVSDLRDGGYRLNNGNSFVMAVEFTDDGPRAEGVLVYAQSDSETSDHATDQLEVYAQGQMRGVRFTEEEIAADPNLEVITLSSEP